MNIPTSILMLLIVAITLTAVPYAIEEAHHIQADLQFDQDLIDWTEANPIVWELPYIEPGIFRVDYGGEEELLLVVTIFVPRYEDESEIDGSEGEAAFWAWYGDYQSRTGDTKNYKIQEPFNYY